jgi:hypothetical protein
MDDEIRCPFCDEVLEETWVKKMGASLMGRSGRGESKVRSSATTSDGAIKRWKRQDELDNAQAEVGRLREQLKKKKKK